MNRMNQSVDGKNSMSSKPASVAESLLNPPLVENCPEVEPQDVFDSLGATGLRIVDVRSDGEFKGELGHITGAELATLGLQLAGLLDQAQRNELIVFVCRSGGRSAHATMMSREMGFTRTMNMHGGMILWNQLGLPTEGKSEI